MLQFRCSAAAAQERRLDRLGNGRGLGGGAGPEKGSGVGCSEPAGVLPGRRGEQSCSRRTPENRHSSRCAGGRGALCAVWRGKQEAPGRRGKVGTLPCIPDMFVLVPERPHGEIPVCEQNDSRKRKARSLCEVKRTDPSHIRRDAQQPCPEKDEHADRDCGIREEELWKAVGTYRSSFSKTGGGAGSRHLPALPQQECPGSGCAPQQRRHGHRQAVTYRQ